MPAKKSKRTPAKRAARTARTTTTPRSSQGRIRYAVVGLGFIAQTAVLPGFKHAPNAELTALVSSDEKKLKSLGRKYKVSALYSYDDYQALLRSGSIDAVYICLPNHLHREYAVQAAEAGIHVLCEKPLAVTEEDCRAMIQAADGHKVRLMTAYRLHFDPATLKAMDEVRRGTIGDPMLLHDSLSHVVKPGNVRRLPREQGGGPMYDLGTYCVNGARTFFGDEPIEVSAFMHSTPQDAKNGVETCVSGLLRFPGDRLCVFECSNGAGANDELGVLGSKGKLHLTHSFEYTEARLLEITVGEKKRTIKVPKRDQFGPEIKYFSDCLLKGRPPQPSGWEGLADVRVIQAVHRAALTGQCIKLEPFKVPRHPDAGQAMSLPPVGKVQLVDVEPPSVS